MESLKRVSDVPISSNAPRPLGAAYVPILLSEVEQEQRPSGNRDHEAIVVGAGLCDGEGERAYTGYAPHITRNFTRKFRQMFLAWDVSAYFFAETSAAMFLPKRLLPKRPESWHLLSLRSMKGALANIFKKDLMEEWNAFVA